MPWIDPTYLDCVVYLYPSEAEAEDGTRIGGTGFLIGLPVAQPSKYHVICVATNKHVIDRGNMTVRINTMDGGRDIVPLDAATWFPHPSGDDLVLCPMSLSASHKASYLSTGKFINKELIDLLDIGPGDEVFVVGRFINHEGRQRNIPSVRFGNIAQMPWEPIDDHGHPQESFLVEARSISGYSGSPVFVYLPPAPLGGNINPAVIKMVNEGKLNLPGVSKKRINVPLQMGPWLLGIDYCHIRWDEPVWSSATDRPVNDDWIVKSNTGMMGVIPAWKILDIAAGPLMKPVLEEAERQAKNAKSRGASVEHDVAVLRKAEPPTKADNPSHEEDFKRLLAEAAKKRPQDH